MNEAIQIENGSALVIAESTSLQSYFTGDAVDPLIQKIEQEVRSHAPDLTTAKGRKAIASLAYKVSQTKTALDKAGKSMNDAKRAEIEIVDSERRKIRDRLDALRDETRKPLDEWEAAEEARIDYCKRLIEHVKECGEGRIDGETYPYAILFRELDEKITFDENTFGEFLPQAVAAYEAATAKLKSAQEAQRIREAQEAELAQLRAEAEARRIADEEAAAKAEAKRLADEQAERERLAAEQAERERVAREKAEVERAAQIEKDKAEAAERAAVAEREASERREKEAAERHARELKEAAEREAAAAQAERDRIAAEQAAADAAQKKRAADKVHRNRIHSEINEALMPITREDIAAALMDGRIPHVKVAI